MTAWSPGISLRELLDNAPMSYVRDILGKDVCALLDLVNGGETDDDQLRAVAVAAIDAEKLLASHETRREVLQLLPGSKRHELAVRLGSDDTVSNPLDYLNHLKWTTGERQEFLEFLGFSVERTQATAPPITANCSPAYGLFPHQRIAAARVKERLYSGPRRVVLHLPTGVGKTRTAASIIADHLRQHEPGLVVWLAHGQELLEQAAAEFEKAWANLGNRKVSVTRIWGAAHEDADNLRDGIAFLGLEKAVSLAKSRPQTLRILAARSSLTIFDETHQIVAPTFQQVTDALTIHPDASLLGLTATPGRTWADVAEDERLSDYFFRQKVILEIEGYSNPVSALIDQGYIARPMMRTVASDAGLHLTPHDQKVLAGAFDIPEGILAKVAHHKKWNLKVVNTVLELLAEHKRVLVFAASVEHCRILSAVLSAMGIDADYVTGESSPRKREQAIRRFKTDSERPMVLCNFGVLTAGFDAPAASAAVIARPTRSLVLYSQMVGRVIRGPKAGGTSTCEIVTVTDPSLPGFGDVAQAFTNWEDIWGPHERGK